MSERTPRPDVVHILPDKLGGVVRTVANLVSHRGPGSLEQGVVLTHNRLEQDTRFAQSIGANWQTSVEFALPLENVRSVLARVARAIPRRPGVLVANDWLELAMLTRHDLGRTVMQVVHGDYDYYYDLAAKHDEVVDVYVACSARIATRLRERMPHRAEHVVHLRHGIELSRPQRTTRAGPLRVLYIGRLDEAKGVLDLPRIDAALRARGVEVHWTTVGDGPARDAMHAAWPASPVVRHRGGVPLADIPAIVAEHDVFVLPTRAEGFPLVLLETMGAGLVPVVSDIPSGVPELVEQGVTGFRVGIAEVREFADAIETLSRDRERLEAMSVRARRLVAEQFDIRDRARDYHELFARWKELRRPRGERPTLHYGSRLDQPWIPNALVYALRSGMRRLRRS